MFRDLLGKDPKEYNHVHLTFNSLLQDRSKPGRQIVTFLLICNLSIWVIYTFEVQKVEESPVQVKQIVLKSCKLLANLVPLYHIQTLILVKCRIKYSWIRMALWFLLEISGGLDGCLSDHCAFQIEFFGYQPWVIIQKLALPLCIFFRQAS